jgi:hypothetical protein
MLNKFVPKVAADTNVGAVERLATILVAKQAQPECLSM